MECITLNDITFAYNQTVIFKNLNLSFNYGTCYILSGLNGTGKSTLLKMIGGKTLCEYDKIKVNGKDPFRDTSSNCEIAYITNDWGARTVAFSGYNMPLQSSIKVKEMMIKLKERFPHRDKKLKQVLGINPEWALNEISDGQRKRVQLYLGLIQPFKICLLDEITVNLDILVKNRLMQYLKKECIQNNACIIYITHIFDGLDDWCDYLYYINKKRDFIIKNVKDLPNKSIYDYLLSEFQTSHDEYVYEDAEHIVLPKKNAGGYKSGVL